MQVHSVLSSNRDLLSTYYVTGAEQTKRNKCSSVCSHGGPNSRKQEALFGGLLCLPALEDVNSCPGPRLGVWGHTQVQLLLWPYALGRAVSCLGPCSPTAQPLGSSPGHRPPPFLLAPLSLSLTLASGPPSWWPLHCWESFHQAQPRDGLVQESAAWPGLCVFHGSPGLSATLPDGEFGPKGLRTKA